ncbi:hypothetical protein [Bradyrhizobium sp. WSM471]|uniref:hypothetical protein n=1 Tax=Bradyrhizobium sp. WSM471 TaxID=319017 RepID=UPI00024D33BE|nr:MULTISPECIES: hypothetical protein [Bradyrhizobium]EHR05400.1 hypothetical protein Bra471DRAFT_06216 [Bradyrhizobium sp. WSM471]UFW40514.1 hypothetical protein BcanWSM471_30550 [Bradyrhizobium canariense]
MSGNQAQKRDHLKNLLAEVPIAVIQHADAEHGRFQAAFQVGDCYLCNHPLKHFDVTQPCPHWLLNPPGFKKRFFKKLSERFGYLDLQNFLRWVANESEFAININDLPIEADGKMLASTIVYEDFEWSFSCSDSDFAGHPTSQEAKHPHYHFQMRVRKQPLIFYNDFHAPFSSDDLAKLEVIRARPPKRLFPHGEGMHDLLNEDTLEDFVKLPADGPSGEPLVTFDAIAIAPTKEGFRVEDVMVAVRKAAKTGARPGAGLLNLKDAKVQGIVRPAEGLLPIAKRKGGRSKDSAD